MSATAGTCAAAAAEAAAEAAADRPAPAVSSAAGRAVGLGAGNGGGHYPASTVLRLQVTQLVCAILMVVFSLVDLFDGSYVDSVVAGLAGTAIIVAAGKSINGNPLMTMNPNYKRTGLRVASTIYAPAAAVATAAATAAPLETSDGESAAAGGGNGGGKGGGGGGQRRCAGWAAATALGAAVSVASVGRMAAHAAGTRLLVAVIQLVLSAAVHAAGLAIVSFQCHRDNKSL